MPIVAAIDPANRCGVALLRYEGRRPKAVEYQWAIRTPNPKEIRSKVADLIERGASTAAIEGQFLHINRNTYQKLLEWRHRWQQELEAVGIAVTVVPPNDWQQGLLRGIIVNTTKREQRKSAAWWYVEKEMKGTPITQDVADAICIGIYAIRNGLLR